MAYAAVSSLFHTIHLFLTCSSTSVASSTRKLLKSARRTTKRLQTTLQRYDQIKNSSAGVMNVEARIRDEATKLEDLIESEASTQFLISQSQAHGNRTRLSLSLIHLKHDVICFVETAKKMRTEYIDELYKMSPHQEVVVAASTIVESDSCDMVGSSDLFLKIRDQIIAEDHHRFEAVISGMAGIGKTALAKKLLDDSLIKRNFDCFASVYVGQKYQREEILRAIIAQVNVDGHNMIMEANEEIVKYFKRCLSGRKYLIILDDVWDEDFLYDFRKLLVGNCSFLSTTRMVGHPGFEEYKMLFLNEEESWELLGKKVFGEEDCPPQLVKHGKKIAHNCEGLPLLILTVAKHLRELPKNLDYWKEVAHMKNSVFDDACDQIYEILVSSYHYINQQSKACFLYMGLFPKDDVVQSSRIINLWCAEGLAYKDSCRDILDNIVRNSLTVSRQNCFGVRTWTKAFKLHIVYRHVSRRLGENSKFMCILSRYDADGTIERIKDKRHLAIYHNTLLAIKDVYNYIETVSGLRSILCTGPYHQYQVPICLKLKLVRVLDALSIRFYEFPVEVVKLIQLRYLSLTTNANLPPSIHKLYFLEYLIVHQHWRINQSVAESYVPVEIWELHELKHLQIIGRNLPHPPPGAILPKLEKLLDVGLQSCCKNVLKSIPKLEKLRIQIESGPNAHDDTCFFDHIDCLERLESFVSVVMNPKLEPKPTVAAPRILLSTSMNNLQKLSLSGFEYPWEEMSKLAELPNLMYLKLKSYAFRGEIWEAEKMRFNWLNRLLIEDADLVQWTADTSTFPFLSSLRMADCHKLKEIPIWDYLVEVELVDCNPLAEIYVNQSNVDELKISYSWKL